MFFFVRTSIVFCHYRVVQERKGNLKDQQNKEETYITNDFSAWKKAPNCFQAYQDSARHNVAASYQLTISQCQDVGELMDNEQSKKRAIERKYLLEVNRCFRYLGRQGIALQGHDGNDNFTQLLRLLNTNDKNILYHLEGKIGHKYTHKAPVTRMHISKILTQY